MDPILEAKLDGIITALSNGLSVRHLETPDQLYTIKDNVIAPAGLTVNESGANLILSYSDNQLSEPTAFSNEDVQQLYGVGASYISLLLLMGGVLFVFFRSFRLFKRFI